MSLQDIYTNKQIEALKCFKKSFFLMILHGAKRSGKTIVNNDLFLLELKRVRKLANSLKIKEAKYILAGYSLGNLERNVLSELRNKYGLKFELNKHNEFELLGVKVCCFGHGKINDMDRIRGMTAFGAYINEGTTGAEKVVREILNRCSIEGSRVIMDTNPDNPEHYIKKDYIDKADNERIIELSFTLYDNSFLSKIYIKNIEVVTPSGVFFQRDILGKWTTAEGAVYQDFDKDKHVISDISSYKFIDYVAGIDWGYEHFGALCVFGITETGEFILLETDRKQHKEIDYWVSKLHQIKRKYGNVDIYADSARPEHVARCRREKLRVHNADKAILAGVERVASLLKRDKLLIYDSKDFLEEVYSYVWDKKSGLPCKVSDDLMDAIRYAIYNYREKKEFKIITS
ncbi:PBSX family phage terminase large subunit [Fusobacterium necrophorum]|uniref:PBSX family phage terminase large subunit n=1 Tax=Fusobacterium necrophorum TaxID=859 RepID=UPI003D9A1B16